jgi:hypothetical protein
LHRGQLSNLRALLRKHAVIPVNLFLLLYLHLLQHPDVDLQSVDFGFLVLELDTLIINVSAKRIKFRFLHGNNRLELSDGLRVLQYFKRIVCAAFRRAVDKIVEWSVTHRIQTRQGSHHRGYK